MVNQVLGFRLSASGSRLWALVSGVRCQVSVLSSQFSVLSSQFSVLSSQFSVLRTTKCRKMMDVNRELHTAEHLIAASQEREPQRTQRSRRKHRGVRYQVSGKARRGGVVAISGRGLVCFPAMWGMNRWASKFLIAVMLAPSIGPLAMPCAAMPSGMHVPATAQSNSSRAETAADSAQPMMHCHHAMAGMGSGQADKPANVASSESTSAPGVRSGESCCESHCCCGAMTSEWAQPAANSLRFDSLFIESAVVIRNIGWESQDRSGPDAARAPPRG
jgi:hypothetical protein